MFRSLSLSPLVLLMFSFSSIAEARVCTPAGELCSGFLSCCEGECKEGICQTDSDLFNSESSPKEASSSACLVKGPQFDKPATCGRELADR